MVLARTERNLGRNILTGWSKDGRSPKPSPGTPSHLGAKGRWMTFGRCRPFHPQYVRLSGGSPNPGAVLDSPVCARAFPGFNSIGHMPRLDRRAGASASRSMNGARGGFPACGSLAGVAGGASVDIESVEERGGAHWGGSARSRTGTIRYVGPRTRAALARTAGTASIGHPATWSHSAAGPLLTSPAAARHNQLRGPEGFIPRRSRASHLLTPSGGADPLCVGRRGFAYSR